MIAMGYLASIAKIFTMPKMKDLTDSPRHVREEMQKGKMNNIDVILLDRDFAAGDQVSGEISRKTKIDMVNLKVPEPLSFFKIGTFYNRTTGRQMMLTVEGYPYGLQLDKELIDQERNDFAKGDVGKDGYSIPILINKLPYFIEKKNVDEQLKKLSSDNYFELTPSMLNDLGNVKLTDGVTEEDSSGKAVLMLVGIAFGMGLLSVIQAFAKGG